jgi:hypothetical protein
MFFLKIISSFRTKLDHATVCVHAHLFLFLDEKRYEDKTKHWIYFFEIIGLASHLQALEAARLPSPALVNMQGMEAMNSVASGFVENLTRGLTTIGVPNGQQSQVYFVFVIHLVFY